MLLCRNTDEDIVCALSKGKEVYRRRQDCIEFAPRCEQDKYVKHKDRKLNGRKDSNKNKKNSIEAHT